LAHRALVVAVALVTAATVVAGAGTALAGTVGVDGVGLRPDLPRHDGDDRPVLDLAHASQLNVEVANSADAPRTVAVYAVEVTEEDGAFALRPRGSADWVTLETDEVRLEPGERTTLSGSVQRHRVPDDVAYAAAAVVERGAGTTVVARAARVFHVRGHDAVPGFDRLVVLAALLMGAVLLGHLLRVRARAQARLLRRRR
jgi:hypothetical protein